MDALELIARLGGTFAVAELTGVKPPSVSEWKSNNRIPDDKHIRLAVIAEARGIAMRKDLRPDDWQRIWPELARISEPTDHHAEDDACQPVLVLEKRG